MDTIDLPSPILSISSSDMFDLIRYYCGQEVLDVIVAQKIYDIQTLLRVNDIFALIRLPTSNYEALKEKLAIRLNDGSWSVLVGFQARVDQFLDAVRKRALLDENKHQPPPEAASFVNQITVSSSVLEKVPLLKSLISLCNTIDQLSGEKDLSSLISMLNCICANLTRTENNYRYSDHISHFALTVFTYAGRNAYRLISMNIPGFLPSVTTIRRMLNKFSFRIHEGQFRFSAMMDYFASIKCSYAFAAEDCTKVITKVVYDSQSNSFIGFNTHLKQGKPLSNQYQTDSYAELQLWFEEKTKSSLINVHMLQPLFLSSSNAVSKPFLLAAYGIDGTFTSEDVMNRWLWLFREAKDKGVRILGYSTDCDARYLRAMRIASGFFVQHIDYRFQNHPNCFKINDPKWNWFFMTAPQLCLFMQVC